MQTPTVFYRSLSVLLIMLSGFSGAAWAHNDTFFDTNPSPHGGQVRMSGPYHLELISEPAGVLVYVTDHGDTKIPTKGWQAQALVLGGGKKTRIALKSAGDNTLRGRGALPAGAKVVLTVKPRAGEEYSARFTPHSAMPAAAAKKP